VSFRAALVTVAVAFVAISVYSARIQKITLTRFGDGDEYFFATEQRVAHQTIRAESPYVYRIAMPWLVANTFPDRIETGFRVYNIAAAAASALLLLVWLSSFGVRPGVAALTTVLYIASWIGPARFLYYYPIYVDPPFIALSMAALIIIHGLRQRFSWARTWALAGVCFAGALVRETMLLVPGTFLFANVRFGTSSEDRPQIPATALALPLLATALAIALCHMVPSEPRRVISVPENSLYLLRDKPLFTIPLSFFMTFGPVIALVLYDWRTVRDVVSKHAYLVVFLGGCFLTSYIGGHENERYLLWAAPVMYLLIALALQRYGAILMRSAWVFVILAGAQALAEHIFFGIPDPSLAVGDWSYLTTFSQKTWGVVNRLLVVDDFSWNLWSYFGSRPFHVLLLAIYIAFSASLIAYLRWAERPRLIDTSR
jgi:hypothetical protein